METNFKHYPIYVKRDGQDWQYKTDIFSDSFENAKKEFAYNITKDNNELSNNIVWLTEENDKVKETGWYDLNYATPELFCSEKEIKEGFCYWNEDVYSWELRDIEDESEED